MTITPSQASVIKKMQEGAILYLENGKMWLSPGGLKYVNMNTVNSLIGYGLISGDKHIYRITNLGSSLKFEQ